jgi:pyruvate/2-oxoglutarate dehydrogenase complex dihydrolipoamide acyltransferase (E2) component
MIYRLSVPNTIEDNEAVRVLEWHGQDGTEFEPGALIVEIETHKALIEVRAGQRGVLREICHDEGAWCPLGDTLAIFSDDPAEPLGPEPSRILIADFQLG